MKNLQKNKRKKEKIRKLVEVWKNRLGLVNWDIQCLFKQEKSPKDDGDFVGIAHIVANTEYKIGTITFLPKNLSLVDDFAVCHELVHLLLAELTGYARANIDYKSHNMAEKWLTYYEEQCVSELERVIMRMYKITP